MSKGAADPSRYERPAVPLAADDAMRSPEWQTPKEPESRPSVFTFEGPTISRQVREVAETPWQSYSRAAPERDYVALLSYLPLNSAWHLPRLVLYSTRIRRQLRKSSGLIGYSLRAGRCQAVLDSVCVGGRGGATGARCRAAACGYHGGTGPIYERDALRPMEREGSELPPRWDDALRRDQNQAMTESGAQSAEPGTPGE